MIAISNQGAIRGSARVFIAGWVLTALGPIARADRDAAPRPTAPEWRQDASDLWYEGALLGNGDLGVVAFRGTDQIIFGVGKNDFWDRRYYFKRLKPLTYRTFMQTFRNHPTQEADRLIKQYAIVDPPVPKGLWPSPKPVCRVSITAPERADASAGGALNPIAHRLDLEGGELSTQSPALTVVSRVQKNRNLVMIRVAGAANGTRLVLTREADPTEGISPPRLWTDGHTGYVVQEMPPEDTYPQGFCCAVAAALTDGTAPQLSGGEIAWATCDATIILAVATTRDAPDPLRKAQSLLSEALREGDSVLRAEHQRAWKHFWDASWIRLDDDWTERLWYQHNYLLACAARPGAIAPGLFGPWIVEHTSAWRGSYTMDYNFEQTFAAALSCNHTELLEPYLETIENMLPAARDFARDVFETDGIAFPHEMFPIDMRRQGRGSQVYVCETPWAVQHFWERYEYTRDKTFLRARAYPIVSACADFLAGLAQPESGGKYAFEPTRSPEHHGLEQGLPFNRNGTPELGFARYIFQAAIRGADLTGETSARVEKWRMVRAGLPDYPRGRNQLGEIFLDCEALPPERHFAKPVSVVEDQRPSKRPGNHGPWMTYNVPTSLLQVWPAGQIDVDSPAEELLTAIRTWQTLKCEGSNDIMIRHVAAARLGIPSLEDFKREVAPRLMLNGSITTQMNPLFEDSQSKAIYQYRANGVYVESFAFPLVINEMMLQSHNGVIKLFPTMDYYRTAEFHQLRAQGGFLVSASMHRGFVLWAEITATVDGPCRVRLPWPADAVRATDPATGHAVPIRIEGRDVLLDGVKDHGYRLEPKTNGAA